MNSMMKKAVTVFIIAMLAVCCTACADTNAVNLMAGIKRSKADSKTSVSDTFVSTEIDFSIDLLKKAYNTNENILLSPVSVMTAFAMVANGANGDTLSEIEAALGCDISKLNDDIGYYVDNLYSSKNSKLKMANSVWYKDYINVKKTFLQTLADSYTPEVYQFKHNDDPEKIINAWVKKNTDGMIKKLFDDGQAKELKVVIANAIAFDAKWEVKFDDKTENLIFTTAKGEKIDVDMMHSKNESYIYSDNAIGFIKDYEDEKYSFMAVMPKNEVDISQYINGFCSEEYSKLINSRKKYYFADVKIPKFKVEYSLEAKNTLKSMEINTAFDHDKADFHGMYEQTLAGENLYLDCVIHRTFMEIDQNGTKAAAVTGAGLDNYGLPHENSIKLVFDSPFVYAIIDKEMGIPIFIGAAMDVR